MANIKIPLLILVAIAMLAVFLLAGPLQLNVIHAQSATLDLMLAVFSVWTHALQVLQTIHYLEYANALAAVLLAQAELTTVLPAHQVYSCMVQLVSVNARLRHISQLTSQLVVLVHLQTVQVVTKLNV